MARRTLPPDEKDIRPKSIQEAKTLIAKVFRANRWNEQEQQTYLMRLGLKGRLRELSADEVRLVVKDLADSRMVLFG